MIQLRKTLQTAHETLDKNKIDHALIGGLALAVYNEDSRSTSDIDLLADGNKKNEIKECLVAAGFNLNYESNEVLQFTGIGFLDVILANRDLTQEMLKKAQSRPPFDVHVVRAEDIIGLKIQAYKNDSSRELQDKADIQKLMRSQNLDLKLIKKYADLINEWATIQKLVAK